MPADIYSQGTDHGYEIAVYDATDFGIPEYSATWAVTTPQDTVMFGAASTPAAASAEARTWVEGHRADSATSTGKYTAD